MCAADVVGLNLQAGEAVRLGIVAQHQVAIALIRVGFLRVGIDPNHPSPHDAGLVTAVADRVLNLDEPTATLSDVEIERISARCAR